MLFSHKCLETFTMRSDGNNRARRGIWLHVEPSPPEPVSGHPGFWPGIAVAVQFGHWKWDLGVGAWADDGIPRVGAYVLRVCSAEAMLEEDLEDSGHGASLTKGQSPKDEVGREGGLGNQD